MTNQEKTEIAPYIIIPRYIVDDLVDGKIQYREYEVYVWVRLQSNVYGIAKVSTGGILKDLPHLSSADFVTKLLRSLRSKKYLYYQDRQGRRGSFRVQFGDWILPNKGIKRIEHLFGKEELRSADTNKTTNKSEVGLSVENETPKSGKEEIQVKQPDSTIRNNGEVRSSHNEYDTHKEIETNESLAKKPFKGIVTQSFVPSNDQEEECWKIALELGDPCMDFILKVLKDSGLETVHDAKDMCDEIRKENERDGKPIKKPAALFNWCVQRIVDGERALKEERERYGDDSIGRD